MARLSLLRGYCRQCLLRADIIDIASIDLKHRSIGLANLDNEAALARKIGLNAFNERCYRTGCNQCQRDLTEGYGVSACPRRRGLRHHRWRHACAREIAGEIAR